MTLIHKIIEAIKESDHEVIQPLIGYLEVDAASIAAKWDGIVKADDFYIEQVKNWMGILQKMSDKAEKFDDVENNMYWINDHLDEIDNIISHIRNQSNV